MTNEPTDRDDEIDAITAGPLEELADRFREAGLTETELADAITSYGLALHAGCLCAQHLIEYCAWLREWLAEKIDETRAEMN